MSTSRVTHGLAHEQWVHIAHHPRLRASCGVALLCIAIVVTIVLYSQATEGNDQTESVLSGIQACINKSPNPWPAEWQQEYIDTIRQVILVYHGVDSVPQRLEILTKAFPPYWETTRRQTTERVDYEMHTAQIRWYVENLMSTPIPSQEDITAVASEVHELLAYGARSIHNEFPFLTPDTITTALQECETRLQRIINHRFVPALRHPLAAEQVTQLKNYWDSTWRIRHNRWKKMHNGLHAVDSQIDRYGNIESVQHSFVIYCLNILIDHRGASIRPPQYFMQTVMAKREITNTSQNTARESFDREKQSWLTNNATIEQIEQWGFAFASLLNEVKYNPKVPDHSSTEESAETKSNN